MVYKKQTHFFAINDDREELYLTVTVGPAGVTIDADSRKSIASSEMARSIATAIRQAADELDELA